MRLLLIIGPPAVGKMTVGKEIAAKSSFRLFHNHHTIEPLSEIFGYRSAPFETLNFEFRRRIFEEAAANNLDLIFSLVWNLQSTEDLDYVEKLVAPYLERNGQILVLELAAALETRLVRNRGESRLSAKPSKRDLEWSDRNVRDMEKWQMNTDPDGSVSTLANRFLSQHPHLRIETSAMTAGEVAELALRWVESDQRP